MKAINRLVMVDSYKSGQYQQVPKGTTSMFSYFESRGSERGYTETTLFGLQYFLKQYYSDPITIEEIEEAKEIAEDRNEPFNYEGWKLMLERHGGYFPIRVRAIPEGQFVPLKTALFTVEATDEDFYWLPDWVETAFCRTGWYGGTVATQSFYLRKLIYKYLVETSDDPDAEIPFKLHDFGARGDSSSESAQIGGAAHLSIFSGSDTYEGVWLMKNFYNEYKGLTASIPASQHSTISSWGKDKEVEAYRNMLNLYKGNGIFACVSDTWNIYKACEKLWGEELKDEVINGGALVVIRPDSGDPVSVLFGHSTKDLIEDKGRYYIKGKYNSYKDMFGAEVWGDYDKEREVTPDEIKGVFAILAEKFGYTLNNKGYKVLNHVRVIQGDGVNPDSIARILKVLEGKGYSATNLAFGMGGALLQKVDRDVNKMAYKCSSIVVDGQRRDVYKDPITDSGRLAKGEGLILLR
jgi:nicotinamide phosphoribosyltransferase